MARVDDYANAKKIAVEKLRAVAFEALLKRSGFTASGPHTLRVPFLDQVYRVGVSDFTFSREETAGRDTATEVPLQEQVLLLHYLMAETVAPPTGDWISYREIPGAAFYFSAFVKRAVDPLKKVFGRNTEALLKTAPLLQGTPIDAGDAGFEFRVLPRVPLQLILWEGDDEFPPEANILFDESIGEILSPEDVAWISGMLVYRLMALGRSSG